ncbi:MAG: putative toxin-antitoxin system toxin component, PIN family [Pseudomonadota bacterium]
MAVRAVLDTQVVVRGLLGIRRSACAALFDALGAGVFVAVASPHIMQELRDVLDLPKLRGRYALTDDEVLGLLDDYRELAEIMPGVIGPVDVQSVPAVPAEDRPIVSAALEGGAEYLVTDDAALLDVKALSVAGYRTVQIIAPGPFVKQVLGVKEPAAP